MTEQLKPLTEAETTELLDWVSACQSSYHIDSTPGHRFGGLGSQLQENRDALVEYVNALIAARAQPAQAVPASCGECGKKTSDGWALYCVACMEKAGLPGGTSSPPLTHSCTSSLVRTADSTAQAGPVLTDEEIRQVAQSPFTWDNYRAIEQAVRAKMGVAVPMTLEQIIHLTDEIPLHEGGGWFVDVVRAAERHHGIVGKEDGNV